MLDVNMPNLNGIEATSAIRKTMPDVAIVGLSVQTDEATAQAMLEAGAEAYLAKDGPVEKLLSSIRRLGSRTEVGSAASSSRTKASESLLG